MEFNQYWEQIYKENDKINSLISAFWNQYSHMGTWQFWAATSLLLIPLILLYFKVDRKRIFELFFFGYTVHLLWLYTDLALARHGYFIHQYFITPLLPFALDMTASVLPVGFLLLYQYCTNNNKNFYLFTILLSAVFAFGFASIEDWIGLAKFRKGMNQFYLFLIDVGITFIAYWMTKFILKLRGKG